MNIHTMRDWVRSAYPGPKWHYKVDHMADNQIIAIYYSMLSKGQFNTTEPAKPVEKRTTRPHQISWDEYLEGAQK